MISYIAVSIVFGDSGIIINSITNLSIFFKYVNL